MDPETQAGTDHAALKEQARQAMLRAQQGDDASTDAEVTDDENDEVVDDAEDDAPEIEPDEDDAEEADEPDGENEDADSDEDDDSATVAEADQPSGKKGRKRTNSKLAKLYATVERLEAENADLKSGISTEVERILADKAEAERSLAEVRAQQDEDTKRVKQVREHVERLRGTDDERDRLTRSIAAADDDPLLQMAENNPLALTPDQQAEVAKRKDGLRKQKQRLQQIIAVRDVYDLAAEAADDDLRERVGSILERFAKSLPGVDPDFHNKLTFGPSIQHVYDAGYERGKAETATEIDRRDKKIANLEGLLSKAKTARPSPAGRIPEGGTSPRPTPKPKPLDQMAPTERTKAIGMIGPDGKIDPEFKRKKAQGLVSLF